jgi:hypothetical protein
LGDALNGPAAKTATVPPSPTPGASAPPFRRPQVFLDATPPRLDSAVATKLPTQADPAFTLRLEFSEPVAWVAAVAAAAAADTAGPGDTAGTPALAAAVLAAAGGGGGAALAAAGNATLWLSDARLVSAAADAAGLVRLTFYLEPPQAAGAGTAASAAPPALPASVPVPAASAYDLAFEGPPGGAARVVVPAGSFRDAAGNVGANDGELQVCGLRGAARAPPAAPAR